MKKLNIVNWIFLILFFLSFYLRKTGAGFASLLITILTLVFFAYALNRYLKAKIIIPGLLVAVFLVVNVGFIQYWFPLGSFPILAFIFWILSSVFFYKKIFENLYNTLLWIFSGAISLSTIVYNPREFHNLYRSSTYEEYIFSKYPEQRGIVADYFIDKYKKPDVSKANQLLEEALKNDSLKNYNQALKLFNKSIDLNPDNAFAYLKRGYFKLTRLDLNEDIAISSIKDFNRAIRLNPDYTEAYFQRGLAYGYIGNRGRALVDLKRVWVTDSSLTDEEFFRRYGSSKKSFSVPFHP